MTTDARIDHENGGQIIVWDASDVENMGWRPATEQELVPALIEIVVRLDRRLRMLSKDY
jgi:hypothetical protein